ncbi:hypothetical protein A2688_04320 [Candidatus Daviesbacteria bacterium RIFCSPHIGHO2_01_FULL_38_8]|nr:MAG: hypothetical protein A2688_04320 [Candidatus Daviesbacteria bacterium RIFCSPHIGHO2_01_FULL_38_8]
MIISITRILSLIKLKKFLFSLVLILLISSFWRFVNFPNRWVLSQDQARDVIISLYSIENRILPPIGPPSSAGPFSFGPAYYLFTIFFTLFSPITPLFPWIGFALISVLSVILLFLAGKKLYGLEFAVIVGLVASFSFREVINATNVLNPILITFAVSLVFFSLTYLIKTKKLIFALLLGISVGLAINFHFQSLGLIVIPFLLLIFSQEVVKRKILVGATILFGTFLVFLQLLLFELVNDWVWSKSIINYLLYGQNKFYIPVRWLTDIFNFWPTMWGEVITGNPLSGYFLGPLFLIAVVVSIWRKKKLINKTVLTIGITFIIEVILIRYYKGPRLPVYLIVTHAFFIFFTAWTIYCLGKINKILSFGILAIILIMSSLSNVSVINAADTAVEIKKLKEKVDSKIINKTTFYQDSESGFFSLLLFYLLYSERKISEDGYKIGFCDLSSNSNRIDCPNNEFILSEGNFLIYDLNQQSEELRPNFENFTAKDVYNSLFLNLPHLVQ